MSFDGQFSVRPIQLELFETTANHAVLRQLSQKYGGPLRAVLDLSAHATELGLESEILGFGEIAHV